MQTSDELSASKGRIRGEDHTTPRETQYAQRRTPDTTGQIQGRERDTYKWADTQERGGIITPLFQGPWRGAFIRRNGADNVIHPSK